MPGHTVSLVPAIHHCLPLFSTRPQEAWLRPWLGSPKYELDRSVDRQTAPQEANVMVWVNFQRPD